MFYLPLAFYWEKSEDGQASPAQRRAAEEVVERLAQLGLEVSLDGPMVLPELPEAPIDLLETVSDLLTSQSPRLAVLLFSQLVAFHREFERELESFRNLYPGCSQVCESAGQVLIGYQQAVGAMVEQDWAAAASLFVPVAAHLKAHRQAMAELRAQHGCSAEWALDELAWSCQRGRGDASGLLSLLEQLESESEWILDNHFPDPRLIEEWRDLWRPRLDVLRASLSQPELSALAPAQQWLDGQRHWAGRARQRRDFSKLPWWRDLRLALVSWFEGRLPRVLVLDRLRQSESWLNLDVSGWPQLDRELRQHHLDQARQLVERIRACLLRSERDSLAGLVAEADASYDRWLWLSLAKA